MSRYKVIGRREVLGQEPGDVFYADLDPVTEARLVAGGHIALAVEDAPKRERVEKNEKTKDEQSDENEHDEESPDEA